METPRIKCGNCQDSHPTVADVKACFVEYPLNPCKGCSKAHTCVDAVKACVAGYSTGVCGWQDWLNEWDEDGQRLIHECPAESWTSSWGWRCARGHANASLETQWKEGWRYVEDEHEAARLRGLGLQVVGMDGGSI